MFPTLEEIGEMTGVKVCEHCGNPEELHCGSQAGKCLIISRELDLNLFGLKSKKQKKEIIERARKFYAVADAVLDNGAGI